MEKDEINDSQNKGWAKAKTFSLVLTTSVVSYKVIVTPFVLTVDFPTLLSLLLAIFSVALASQFYFKATETSNTFYDNTYKFTQDIASLLVKMESGFGEKLRHLDEGYTNMRDKLDKFPGKYEIEEANKEIKKEEEEFNLRIKEKDKIIDELAQKAHLKDSERDRFKEEINRKIEELGAAKDEIRFLRNRVEKAVGEEALTVEGLGLDEGMKDFIMEYVFNEIPARNFLIAPSSLLAKRFRDKFDGFPKGFIKDLEKYEMIDEDNLLTRKGKLIFRMLAKLKTKSMRPIRD